MHHTRTVLFALAASFTLAVHAQTRLSGTITDAQGQPIAYADVVVGEGRFHVPADEHGTFRASGLWPGPVPLHVAAVGAQPLDTVITLAEGDNTIDLLLRTDRRELSTVEVSALRAGDRAPFAKSVMTKEEIARVNTGTDLPYMLELQPSVVSTSDGGTGIGYTYMRIRGTDGTRTNVTVNGVPFNDAESQGAFFVDLPDLASSAEDIEVQRGVGTSTNGPAAFGASVNVRTTAVKREAWGLLTAGGGSFNTQRYSVSAGTGLLGDHFSLDMRLSSITSDGYIDRASADLKSYFLQAAWIGRTNTVRFITFRGKERTYQAWDGVPREVIDTNRTYNGFTYEDQVDDFDQTNYQLLFDQKLGANAAFNLTLFRVDGEGFFEQFQPDDDLSTYGIASAVINGDTITTTDIIRRRWLENTLTGANASIDAKLGRQRLVIGGSYSDYRCAHFGEVIWARYAGDTDIRDRYYDNDAKKTDANGFAKLTYALSDRVDAYGDVQLRHVTYSYLGFDDVLANRQQQLEWTFFNPKAGVLWRVREGDKAYASFAVGNREPNRDDLEETTPTSRPRPEQLFDYELGYEHRGGRFSAGVNLYYMDYTDQLVLTGELNDVGAALRTNVKSSYRAGVEVMGAAQLTKRLLWRANATFSRNKVRDLTEFVDDWDNGGQVAALYGESDLAFSPSVIAGSELSYRVWDKAGHGRADLTFVTKYVGEQFLDNSASTDRMLDAYVVNDLRANVTLLGLKGTKGIDLNLTVRNLFSELYESNGWVYSYVLEGRRQEMVGLFPQAQVNVLGGVTVRF
ncbi:MAG TPA: TonB-dependent receptor [Flavobacteriales bacterium]|nr:TonB-dependent receptor [Flavobacteriales bacterium]